MAAPALDCRTPEGRIWIARQRTIVVEVARAWGCRAIITPDTTSSAIDVLFSDARRVLRAIAEVKARDLTLTELRGFGSYLITYAKLEQGARLAKSLCVPYLLIVGLSDAVVWWRIADDTGTIRALLDVRQTRTQRTCNGGETVRANAYLGLAAMKVVALSPVELHRIRHAQPTLF